MPETFPIHTTLFGDTASPVTRSRIVFLHGLLGRGRNFSAIALGLQPEHASLLVDLPNHGQSGWTHSFDYEELADLVAAELARDIARSEPVDLVGHSMGGKVAMVLALRHPELVRRLVVVDISPVPGAAARSEFPQLLEALIGLDLGKLHKRIDAHAALRSEIPNDTVRGFLLQNLKRTDHGFSWEPNLALLHGAVDEVMGFPQMQSRQFAGPVLWLRGEHSNYVTDADAPAMRALFPKVQRVTVRGAGHWVHSERPAETIAILRNFLR